MDLKQLMEMGLSEEQAKAVLAQLDGSFVTKNRFNSVNDEKKTLEKTLKERDEQLEQLKAAGGNPEELQKQITSLQAENAAKEEAHKAELRQLRLDTASERQIMNAKAKNPTLVKALLKEEGFFEKAELEEDGTVKGLENRLQELGKAEDSAFLFSKAAEEKAPGLVGLVPGERKEGAPGPGQPSTLQEAVEMALQPTTNT